MMKTVTKNKMKVKWYHQDESIYFEIKAPTTGWLAIGFNKSSSLTGTYLIMGNVVNNTINVVEHYTLAPAYYCSFNQLGQEVNIDNVTGIASSQYTQIMFSLPMSSTSRFTKDLIPGNEYSMLMAYSLKDDFQHHSIMRTSVKVKL